MCVHARPAVAKRGVFPVESLDYRVGLGLKERFVGIAFSMVWLTWAAQRRREAPSVCIGWLGGITNLSLSADGVPVRHGGGLPY